jgi:hypothetical protein
MQDDAQHVRHELEVERLRTDLADEFVDVEPDAIERGVRTEFDRRADYPVQDFVSIFVERSVRGRLRSHTI